MILRFAKVLNLEYVTCRWECYHWREEECRRWGVTVSSARGFFRGFYEICERGNTHWSTLITFVELDLAVDEEEVSTGVDFPLRWSSIVEFWMDDDVEAVSFSVTLLVKLLDAVVAALLILEEEETMLFLLPFPLLLLLLKMFSSRCAWVSM